MKRIVGACPRLDAIKQSVYIEGACMVFARAKVHWGKLDAEKLMTEGPPEGICSLLYRLLPLLYLVYSSTALHC